MNEREVKLDRALKESIEHSMELCREITARQSDLLAVRDLLSPSGNTATGRLRRLRAALILFHPRELCAEWFVEWHEAAIHLIQMLKYMFPTIVSFQETWEKQCEFYEFLTEIAHYSDAVEYSERVHNFIHELRDLYNRNSRSMTELIHECVQREKIEQGATRPRKKFSPNDRRVFDEMGRLHQIAEKRGEHYSYLQIAENMKRLGAPYASLMKRKNAQTWANQASSYLAESAKMPTKKPYQEIDGTTKKYYQETGKSYQETDRTTKKHYQETENVTKKSYQETNEGDFEGLSDTGKRIVELIREDETITQKRIAERLGLTHETAKYHLRVLKLKLGIRHEGATKKGRWVVAGTRAEAEGRRSRRPTPKILRVGIY